MSCMVMHNCGGVSSPESRCPSPSDFASCPAGMLLPASLQKALSPNGLPVRAFRAEDELTSVCHEDRVLEGVQAEAGWVCLRTIGPFDFQAAGIVHSLIAPLSSNGIGVFVVCTFDGEHLLIAESDCGTARDLLGAAGHKFLDEAERT